MASTRCQLEEIPRGDLSSPRVRLQIIHLTLDDRGRGNGDPSATSLQRYEKPVLRRLHKLESFSHLLNDAGRDQGHDHLTQPFSIANGTATPRTNVTCDKQRECNTNDDRKPKYVDGDRSERIGNNSEPFTAGDESSYVFFIKGMNSAMVGDRNAIIQTLGRLINHRGLSLARREYQLLSLPLTTSVRNAFKHVCLHAGMTSLHELMEQGRVLEKTGGGVVGVVGGVALTLCFHKDLARLSRTARGSRVAQLLSDTWLSFGCATAVLISASIY